MKKQQNEARIVLTSILSAAKNKYKTAMTKSAPMKNTKCQTRCIIESPSMRVAKYSYITESPIMRVAKILLHNRITNHEVSILLHHKITSHEKRQYSYTIESPVTKSVNTLTP